MKMIEVYRLVTRDEANSEGIKHFNNIVDTL